MERARSPASPASIAPRRRQSRRRSCGRPRAPPWSAPSSGSWRGRSSSRRWPGRWGSPPWSEALARALDSEQFDNLWTQLLASDEAQRLVERIAEAPEVRAAVTAQGVGLMEDLGRQLRRVARRLDDGLERVVRRIFGRPQRTDSPRQAGLVTRALAFGLDAGILNGIFIVIRASSH